LLAPSIPLIYTPSLHAALPISQPFPFRSHAAATAGHLNVKCRMEIRLIHRRRFNAYVLPIGIQLVGRDHWQRSVYARAHLRLSEIGRAHVISPNSQEGVRMEDFGSRDRFR